MKGTLHVFPSRINNVVFQGLEARDYIAILSLPGLLANPERSTDPDTVAAIAYEYTDAMLKQSEVTNEQSL